MALAVLGAVVLAPFPAPARDQTADTSIARPAEAGIPHLPPPPRPAALGRSYATVFRAIELRDWAKARALAAQTDEPVLSDLISWVRFTTRGEYMAFDEVTAFIEAHPDWPQMRDLRENAEEALNERVPDARVLAWFEKHPPITPKGAMYVTEALMRTGETARAEDLVRRTWVEENFSAPMERTFYGRYSRLLRATDHERRIDRLLWDGRGWEARRLLRRIKSGYNAVAVARMRLRAYAGGVDWALRRVPDELSKDPGLVYERLRWRRRKGRDNEAIELLKDLPAVLPRPALVWYEQGILARRALREGKADLAYRLASDHRQQEGESFADAEFLAGFIALRHLNKPDVALAHFTRLFDGVNYPVSRARGAYWAGRSARELGDKPLAALWFELGTAHFTTFYGQLAAIELDNGRAVARPIPEAPAVAETAADTFARRDVVRAAQVVAQSPERDHFKSFVRHLVRLARTPEEHALASSIAIAAGRSDVAVWAAKDSLKEGVHLIDTGWPREPLPENRRGLEIGIVLALMRQESAFNPDAVSWAGARGLMQLMPATARKVAKGLGLPFSRERLLNDPAYNMAIGSTYFSQVLEEFSGSYALALAAYNAGPSRARRWLKDLGDFRRGEIDAVDWIEMIPFDETRDYVQRVIENVQVYRALFNGRQMRIIPPGSIGG
ncbi:MAG: transglycosylase SLT domain-containing protein [Alphaproteobacteria bacterium]|nr:transglycosylase SLT domain-containing protein [Alphaproteobacteria bacterium]